MGVGDQCHAQATLSLGKRSVIHCIGGWVAPRAGLDGCGKSCPPTRSQSLDLPACCELLYRLSYPGPMWATVCSKNVNTGKVHNIFYYI